MTALPSTTHPVPAEAEAPQGPADGTAVHDRLTVHTLEQSLRHTLAPDLLTRLDEDGAAVSARGRAALDPLYAGAGRRYGRGPLPGWSDWHIEDAVRAVLLLRLPDTGADLAAHATELYRGGDAAERRGILNALPFLPLGAQGLGLVRDALRTHDNRLIAAALGPYARTHLDQEAWRKAVLKCLFTGVPLRSVAGLTARADAELSRLALGFAHERRAAGRPVPDDLWLVAAPAPAP